MPRHKATSSKKLGVLTITRGEERQIFRKQLIKNIKKQSYSKKHMKHMKHILIDYPPKSNKNDMLERFKLGLIKAFQEKIDWLYIFEDDDYYTEVHAGVLCNNNNYAIAGITETTYYNLKTKSYRIQRHKGRSSLFATALNPSYFIDFIMAKKDSKYLDVELWEYARQQEYKIKYVNDSFSCLGIKHGLGLCGGKGHDLNGLGGFIKDDINLSFLNSRVDNESFYFYKNLAL